MKKSRISVMMLLCIVFLSSGTLFCAAESSAKPDPSLTQSFVQAIIIKLYGRRG